MSRKFVQEMEKATKVVTPLEDRIFIALLADLPRLRELYTSLVDKAPVVGWAQMACGLLHKTKTAPIAMGVVRKRLSL